MTIAFIIKRGVLYKHNKLTFVIMGSSEKAEERIFRHTNYFEELSHLFPRIDFTFHLIGPEMSIMQDKKSKKINSKMIGYFHKCTVSRWLKDNVGRTIERVHS